MNIQFNVQAKDGQARVGSVATAHGAIRTPAFMPVGTVGSVKGLTPDAVAELGADIILGNTYHLMLRPTAERVARMGGLRKFMQWDGPILTDSGGFQVMSLSDLRKLTEEGVRFRSHVDGSYHDLSPERAMQIQDLLDSTISMVLDECTPYPATHKVAEASMERSMRWAKRSKDAFRPREGYAAFGIAQGSTFEDLRIRSCEALRDIGFDGYAVGGLAVGEGQQAMFDTLDMTLPHLPVNQPRYLMGVGKPDDILGAVERGIDMFDCVIPTRSGRLGRAYTNFGELNIRNARYTEDEAPVDAACGCYVCRKFTRAYLQHLFKAGEMLGPILMSWHNLSYYQQLMQQIRSAIAETRLHALAVELRANWKRGV